MKKILLVLLALVMATGFSDAYAKHKKGHHCEKAQHCERHHSYDKCQKSDHCKKKCKDHCKRHKKHKTNAVFETFKNNIVGSWVGSPVKCKKTGKCSRMKNVHVNFKSVNKGTAIKETIFPGTKMEMTSLYYPTGKKGIKMIHYCMIGNHPVLRLSRYDGHHFVFKLVRVENYNKKQMGYMSGLVVAFKGHNHMYSSWSAHMKGKTERNTMHFKRVK